MQNEQQYQMTADDVIDFYKLCEENGIEIWVDGGWCVDALLGKQIRIHNDLDIGMEWKYVSKLRQILEAKGYQQTTEDSKWNFVLTDVDGHSIDIHAFVLNDRGENIEGIAYPVPSLTGTGFIDNKKVNCIDAKHMVKFLAPWVSKHPHKYVQAISELCKAFDLPFPPEYLNYVSSTKL
jgi:lincosamide nucleotidyltransferase A/C/D/E